MKKRIRMFFNFFAFNLLFFALYLNFIYEDAAAAIPVSLPVEKTDIQITPLPALLAPALKENVNHHKVHRKALPVEKGSQALKLSMN